MAETSKAFHQGKPFRETLHGWWLGLEQDRGGRAFLRRCRKPLEVFGCESFHQDLLAPLRRKGIDPNAWELDRLAALAGLFAHVKTEAKEGLAKVMARPKRGGTQPTVSPLRFRRLLAVEDLDELYLALVRMLRLVEGLADPADLSRIVFEWGDKTRRNLSLNYFALVTAGKQ